MKFYYSPGACSLASHIVMCELGMTYTLDKVNLADKTCSNGTYLTVNANGYVPALQTDKNEVITEGVAIMSYLADQKPEANLIPKAGTMDRYKMTQTLNFIATELHKNYSPIWAAKRISANESVQTAVTDFYKANLSNRFDYINQILAKNEFIFGNTFTVADAYLFTVLNWNKMLGIDTSRWSSIDAYMTKIFKRPSVQKAMKEEGILN
jgi:glutathione S-transferase